MNRMVFTKYDFLCRRELRHEMRKRGISISYVNAAYKMRHLLEADDIKNKKPIPLIECPGPSQTLREVLKQ